MGLSTHVLDTTHGCPAAGMHVQLLRLSADEPQLLQSFTLNADGRNPSGPLLDNTTIAVGKYQLRFAVADYFRSKNITLPDPPFLDWVSLDFGIANVSQHYHVPLLCTPWSYSTYRGS